MSIKRPSLYLTAGLLLLLALTMGAAVLASRLILLNLNATSVHGAPLHVSLGGPELSGSLIGFGNSHGRFVRFGSADYDLIHRTTAQLPKDAIATNDKAVSLAADGKLRVLLRNATGQVVAVERAASPSPLGASFWMLIFTGLFGGVVGLWVAIMRPAMPAALAVGGSGLGLLMAAYPVGIILNGELLLGGTDWLALMRFNYVGIQIFAGCIALVLAIYPVRLIPVRVATCIFFAMTVTMIVVASADYDLATRFAHHSLLAMVSLLAIVAAASAQFVRTRHDPVGRAYLRLVGSTSVVSTATWVVTTLGPQLMGSEPLLNVASGALLMVPIYAAIAFGIVRGQMFDVDRWAWSLLASSLTLVAIFAIEAGLAVIGGFDRGPATSVAFMAVGCGWFLARHRLLDRLLGSHRVDATRLLGSAHHVVLAPTEDERFARWCHALGDSFAPLEIVTRPDDAAAPEVGEAGLSLVVPAPRFGVAVTLRSAQRGRALFRAGDRELVARFAALCDRIDDDRLAYDRGMRAERVRIAQDLHDDVAGLLLTGLHRTDATLVRSDIRHALADLRTIVAGLEGDRIAIGAALADIRSESSERLTAAGVEVDWSADIDGCDDVTLDHGTLRGLASIIRELTTNVIRHSRATGVRCHTRCDRNQGRLIVVYADNGDGLSSTSPGNGRRNVARRAEAMGGDAIFCTDAGTRVTISLPLALPPTTALADTAPARTGSAVKA